MEFYVLKYRNENKKSKNLHEIRFSANTSENIDLTNVEHGSILVNVTI